MSVNIMITGVGGQGTLLASRIIGHALSEKGQKVKISEVHGMSQRGGSVVTYVRYGDDVYSPVINHGEADFILSFEQLESARFLPYLKKGGTIVSNTKTINPMPVIAGKAVYPENIIEKIRAKGVNLISCDATGIAAEAGNPKAANVVLIGVLSNHLDIGKENLREAVKSLVPEKFLELNLRAFDMGAEIK